MLMRGEIMLSACGPGCVCVCVCVCECAWAGVGVCGRLCGHVSVRALHTVYIMYACMNLGTCNK